MNDDPNRFLLPLLVALPVLGGLLLLVPKAAPGRRFIQTSALFWSLLVFLLALVVFFQFDPATAGLQLASQRQWLPGFGITFGFGIDSISLWLVLLTTFLMPLVILGSYSAVKEREREFYLWLLLLEAAMVGTFIATDIIFFYICFEFTLVPMYFLIGIFGSNQRLKAAKVFFLYTFTGSMLTLAGVLYVAYWHSLQHGGQWSFNIANLVASAHGMNPTQQALVLFALLAGFAVKVPLFPVHTWLPLAHTEAPTAGSVILAGVLLKLGTYGLLRLAIPMVPDAVVRFAPLIAVMAIIGILYTALICWVQKDIKKLIAYSSVSHLGFCVLGMFALNTIGMSGSVLYMVNHGLSTGALFLCIGMIYERFHTRELRELGGLARVMPVWGFFMVYFCLASVGLPGLNGFVSEFLSLLGAFSSDGILGPGYAIAATFGMILGAIYLLYLVGKVVWGPLVTPDHANESGHGHGHHDVKDLNGREISILTLLAIACLGLGLYPAPVLDSLNAPLQQLAAPARAVAGLPAESSTVQIIGINPTKAVLGQLHSGDGESAERD